MVKKKKINVPEKDLSNIFKSALEMIDKLDDNLEDLVEFSCNLKLLLRKIKNKMSAGIAKEIASVKDLPFPKKDEVTLDELIIIDANDLDILDGTEEL